MTSKLALIEWLPETRTLKDAILSARTEDELKRWQSERHNPDLAYHKFIEEASAQVLGTRDGKSWFNHDLINPFVID